MSVYRKFERNEILSTTVHASPRVSLASGSTGWRGNVGTSSSLSLYSGIRSRRDVRFEDFGTSGISVYPLDQVDTHSVDKVIFVSGSYPATGSVQFVKVRNSSIGGPSNVWINHENWYEEHFRPIELLYDYYSRTNDQYFTGSYDYYSLFLHQNSADEAPHVLFSGSQLDTVSSSFTVEARIKPTLVSTGSRDFAIQSQERRWKLFISGSGKLAWSDYATTITSSATIERGVWQHVACTVADGSASLYVDLEEVARVSYTGTLSSSISALSVGAEYTTPGAMTFPNNGFSGYIRESRIWSKARTFSELSGAWNSTIVDSGSSYLRHYARFNDGPLSTQHGFVSGSGAFDYSQGVHGQFVNVDQSLPRCPQWQPCDDVTFLTQKTRVNTPIQMMRVLHVPSMFYGRQIATGSVRLTCNSYSGKGISRVLVDDGRGALYVSGSTTREISGEDYTGVQWNKVGNVFYTEGLIVITEPSLLDFGETGKDWSGDGDYMSAQFDGLNMVPTKYFICRLGSARGNGSRNPTYSILNTLGDSDASNDRLELTGDPTTWVSAVGIYNEDRKLVAVAKLASPIRKREKDKITFKLRMDF